MSDVAALYARELTRLLQELDAFPEELLWKTLPGVANPAGNLLLHLEGNLREYIGRQMGGVAYTRQRPREFSDKNLPKAELAARFGELQTLIPDILEALPEAQLDAEHPTVELGRPHTTRQWLLHLFGHFNYHLGQIDYLRRVLTGDGAVTFATLK